MRKQHGNLELIEVFAPDDLSSWADGPAEDVAPAPMPPGRRKPRRRVVAAGVVAVCAFVGGAVALSNDSPSESASSTSVAGTPTTLRGLLDPSTPTHYLLEDPALTPYSADIVTPPASGEQVHVWTDGTDDGPIVIVELHRDSGKRYGIRGATREVVDGYELVQLTTYCPSATPTSSKQCHLLISEVSISDEWSVTVRATRLSPADVTRIASSVQVIDNVLAENSDLMRSLDLGLTIETESLRDLIFGRVETEMRYLTTAGEIATLRIAVGDPDQWFAGLRLTTDAQPSLYNRKYGHLVDTGEAFVAWEDEGKLLSLVGPGDAGELVVISRQVRPATDAEWSAMLYGLRPDFRVGDFATLATGYSSTNELWRAGPQLAERAGRTEYLWWWTVPGRDDFADSVAASSDVGSRPHFETLVVPGATFVFVSNPTAGGTVTVHTSTGAELTAELVQPFAQSPVYMTVVRTEDPGPVTVEIDGVGVPQ